MIHKEAIERGFDFPKPTEILDRQLRLKKQLEYDSKLGQDKKVYENDKKLLEELNKMNTMKKKRKVVIVETKD